MKKTFKFLSLCLMLAMCLAVLAVSVGAADASALTFQNCDGGVMVADCKESASGEIKIPDEYNGSKVVKIGSNAFADCDELTSVVIPNSVLTVGSNAFINCTSLKKADLGIMTTISDGMFEGCSSLSEVKVSSSLTDIGEYAFFGCDSLKSIILYPGVKNIGAYAFYDCGLERIALPETVTVINDGTFGECEKLVSVSIHDSVVEFGTGAFYGCDAIDTVYFTGSMGKWSSIRMNADNDDIYNGSVSYKHLHEVTSETFNEPTCTKTGLATNTCACGYVYISDVDALGHKAETIKAIDATCTEAGKTAGEKCARCDVILTEPKTIPATGHKTVVDKGYAATCTKTGLTNGSHCEYCGEVFEKQEIIPILAHDQIISETVKATTKRNGKITGFCNDCGEEFTRIIYNVSSIKLSTSVCTYNGKKRTPSVIVKDSEGATLVKDTDYTVKYADGRKNPGKYTIKVIFKGIYEGSKSLKFTIAPGKTDDIKAVAAGTKSVKLTWDKVTGATGYRVYVYKSTDTKTRVRVASVKTNSYTLKENYSGKSLKMGKSYKIAIVAYTKTSSDVVIFAEAGVAHTFKFVPPTPSTLKVSSSAKGKVTASWTNVAGETGYQLYYSTDNKSFKKLESYKGHPGSVTEKGLKSGKKYYFKVRAYAKVDGETVFGSFSSVKSVKIK